MNSLFVHIGERPTAAAQPPLLEESESPIVVCDEPTTSTAHTHSGLTPSVTPTGPGALPGASSCRTPKQSSEFVGEASGGEEGPSDEMAKREKRRGVGQEHSEHWPLDPHESSNLSLSPDARDAGHTSTESNSSGEDASVGDAEAFSDNDSDSGAEAQRLLTTDDSQLVHLLSIYDTYTQ